jgi:primosomal protein N' (replication factor Y) (superfamily II helicase)
MNLRYVDVALPISVDRFFTYSVPPEIDAPIQPGTRVMVPFGRKLISGLVVDCPAASNVQGIKPITDILDLTPVLPPGLLSLCRWISSYYFCPLGEVLKAAMPQGYSSLSKTIVRPTDALTGAGIASLNDRTGKRKKVLASLLERGEASPSVLSSDSGIKAIHAVLNEFAAEGLISLEERLAREGAGRKTVDAIDLDRMSEAAVRSHLESLPSRQKAAARFLGAVLDAFREQDRFPVVSAVMRASQASSPVVKGLRESGLIVVTPREVTRRHDFGSEAPKKDLVLNAGQQAALDRVVGAMDAGNGGTFLLQGVTGSGKTQVYIEAIRHCRSRGKAAIVLVPEISLTPQMVRRFTTHFGGDVAVVHSRMSPGERYDAWRLASTGRCHIMIGPRSAIFAPFASVGLIVVDEEHEATYKQFDSSPRYHARDVAIVRASLSGAVALLGSATPSAESFFNAAAGRYTRLSMPERIDNVPLPPVTVVDMLGERKALYAAAKEALPFEQRGKLKEFVQPSVSRLLREKITDRLSRKEGIILLQNRRGFAPVMQCAECGEMVQCEDCAVTMTYHLAQKHLRCHYCGRIRPPVAACPACKSTSIQLKGVGTQRVEEELASLFPDARTLRMDLDTTARKYAHDRILKKFGSGEADILLGTQMVAKGLDFDRVTLVGVISADTQMLLPDFRASERTFQLMTQVAGRAGRGSLRGEVVLQTHHPGHGALVHVLDHDVEAFFREELEARRETSYPPYSRLVLVEFKGEDEAKVQQEAERFASRLAPRPEYVDLLGPAPAVIGKIKRNYRWHILLKSAREQDPNGSDVRSVLRRAIEAAPVASASVRITVDVDPAGTL